MSTSNPTILDKINASFSGHETFPFRYTWLKKGVDAVDKVKGKPTIFANDDATITLGVGKNMVRSIHHWCQTAGLIEGDGVDADNRRRFVPTDRGDKIFADDGFDPYLEDVATLWILHWQLATNVNRATTWFWAFSIFGQNEFRKEVFIAELIDWTERNTQRISEKSIARDVDCFLRTYVPSHLTKTTIIEDTFDCPLVELNLISSLPDGNTYRFHRGPKPSLPIEIFAAALSDFWEVRFSGNNSLTLANIAYSESSPGRTFLLDEDTLVEYLDKLENLTDGALRYDETAGMKQVHRRKKIAPMELFNQYYRGNPPAY
ncbi:DUF4007 domain-containing protein [Candidatus Poribacteria bacterium]|nr:MAG: DUF4007 domain-containing protein [Candidatus Poribacteria bacterium]